MTLQEFNFLNTSITERTVLNLYLLISITGKKMVRTADTVYCSSGSDIFERRCFFFFSSTCKSFHFSVGSCKISMFPNSQPCPCLVGSGN